MDGRLTSPSSRRADSEGALETESVTAHREALSWEFLYEAEEEDALSH